MVLFSSSLISKKLLLPAISQLSYDFEKRLPEPIYGRYHISTDIVACRYILEVRGRRLEPSKYAPLNLYVNGSVPRSSPKITSPLLHI